MPRTFNDHELMLVDRGVTAIEAALEHLEPGKPLDQIDIDLLRHGVSHLNFALKDKVKMNKLYGAVWCGNCKTAKAFLDGKGVSYEYVDIDENMELAKANTIRSLPTMITEAGDRLVGSAKITEYVNSQGN